MTGVCINTYGRNSRSALSILKALLVIAIAIAAISVIVSFVEDSSASDGGNSGGIIWAYNEGVLTIEPNPDAPVPGQMIDYASLDSVPWKDYRESITSVVIVSGVKNIGAYSFNSISSSYTINALPESVKAIGDNAFMMSSLTGTVDLSPVETIGERAFNVCDEITGKIILKNVTTMDSGSAMSRSFLKCGGTGFDVDGSNTNFKSVDGVLYDLRSSPNKLVCCPTGVSGTVTVKDAAILSKSFNSCDDIETIIMKGTVTLSNQAFLNCYGSKTFIFITDSQMSFVNNFTSSFDGVKIYVPSGELEAYKTASGWSSHASLFNSIVYVSEPVPVADLIYNGGEQTGISASDDDLSINGDVKATNAGSYEAYLTPLAKDGRLWSDTSSSEERTISWEIGKKQLLTSMLVLTGTYVYDGTPKKVSYTVSDGDPSIIKESDYKVYGHTYTDASNSYLCTISATPDGNYKGIANNPWSIAKATISDVTTSFCPAYNGSAQLPAKEDLKYDDLTVRPSGLKVTISAAEGYNCTSAGTQYVKVKVKGDYNFNNYEGTVCYSIDQKELDGSMIHFLNTPVYSGIDQSVEFEVYDQIGTIPDSEYTYTGNVGRNAGTYTLEMTATGTGNYKGSASSDWMIGKRSLADCSIVVTSTLYYTGLQQTVSFDVKIDSVTVSSGDYTVSGNTGVAAGPYVLTVTAAENGNLTGSVDVDWTINRKVLDASMIAIMGPYTYSGKEQAVTFIVHNGTVMVPSEEYTVTGNTGTDAGTYVLSITAADPGNYTGSVSKDWTIEKKVLKTPSELEKNYVYTGSMIQFEIPETDWYKIEETVREGKDLGKYPFHYAIDVDNCVWESEWDHIYSVYINKGSVAHEDESGNTDVIMTQDGGIKKGFKLSVTEKEPSSVKDADIGSGTAAYVLDIKLVDSKGKEVKSGSNIVLKILIPEDIRDKKFDIYHIHGTSEKIDYSVDGVYAVVEPKDLSDFVFVLHEESEVPSFLYYLLGGIILAIILVPIISYVFNPRKKSE